MSDSPISKLFVSGSQAFNEADLYSLLLPYLSIDKDSHEIIFTQQFQGLNNTYKILIFLAAIKAKSLHLKTSDEVSPSDIIKTEIMPVGSVKATLKLLSDSKEIRSNKGKYSLPNYKISQLSASLNHTQSK